MGSRKHKQYVLIIVDGAGDVHRILERSPLALARTNGMDFIARHGFSGVMSTLYPDLPRGSLVAQLGIFGWAPHEYYPAGRASSELLALRQIQLGPNDLVFRANIARMEGSVLTSYNADFIDSSRSQPLVQRINRELGARFPQFELYHNSDFRNTLVVRDAPVSASDIICAEPHESHGMSFDIGNLVRTSRPAGEELVCSINRYLAHIAEILWQDTDYVLFPWGASNVFCLPPFCEHNQFEGRAAIVGNMDFLHGLANAGKIDFYKVGNGRPDTNYRGKGKTVLECLADGYDFVACHINGPDEASHMYDVPLKMTSIESADEEIVLPVIEYFMKHPSRLGGVMVLPDHYTNTVPDTADRRIESHSLHPVPFAVWNAKEADGCGYFSEDEAAAGRHGTTPVSHLRALQILGVCGNGRNGTH